MNNSHNISEDSYNSQLRQEYQEAQTLFEAQPAIIQRYLEEQAKAVAQAILDKPSQFRFILPDRVIIEPGRSTVATVPKESREQLVGGLLDRLTRTDIRNILRQRMSELEQSHNKALATCGRLIRFSTAVYMVHGLLPSGRSVKYVAEEGEEIPSIPVIPTGDLASAITADTDAIVEEGAEERERGELLVPYVPAARHFYLPQWVAFDEKDELILRSVNESEAAVESMQQFLSVLHGAVGLAPYIVVDDEYQQKRYGILGQMINQGRALARYQTQEIIHTIKARANRNDLNRGLSLSLPFFDDQDLQMKIHAFEVIPAGRVMFIPAFVVRAARDEIAKVAQDTRLSPSTRKYLLQELRLLEQSFIIS